MKLILLVLSVVFPLSFIGCSPPPPAVPSAEIQAKLVGKWSHDYDLGDGIRAVGTTIYHADQTWSSETKEMRGGKILRSSNFEGNWRTVRGRLIMERTNDPEYGSAAISVQILSITDQEYRYLHPKLGEQFETRIAETPE